MDPSKAEAILNWPTPRTTIEVKKIHGLASFYRKFVKNFSGVCAPIIDTIKGRRKCKFVWINDSNKSFEYLKRRVAEQPIFTSLDF